MSTITNEQIHNTMLSKSKTGEFVWGENYEFFNVGEKLYNIKLDSTGKEYSVTKVFESRTVGIKHWLKRDSASRIAKFLNDFKVVIENNAPKQSGLTFHF
ncbi:hypothetical protein D5018_11495 [Parashewanella curva]|uniref:Uncharacterized protein n=1 Tax=Parashewanella curva TaxID=2338552 RepID=A0A3L8PWA5_9GAMM|nr:hypothetical protein [Parashewanella curva]RLV59571.1 hypothetical protein D5018_11495 [Parashewanella curva]